MSYAERRRLLGIALVAAGLLGLSFSVLAWPRTPNLDDAVGIAEEYLNRLNNRDLAIDEVMEFQYNYYIVYYEKSTGIGAFEMIIDKPSAGGMMGGGYIRPEQGPNMMWNTKYGMQGMGGGMMGWGTPRRWNTPATPSVTEAEAKQLAQQYLDENLLGARVGDVHPFYGYYTIHVEKDGRIYGMLSVNAYTGEVWYHDWHGAYIQTREIRGE